MILAFMHWSMMSKSDKLDALKETAENLDKSLRIVSQRHERLMAHLGLVEVAGPRIEAVSK